LLAIALSAARLCRLPIWSEPLPRAVLSGGVPIQLTTARDSRAEVPLRTRILLTIIIGLRRALWLRLTCVTPSQSPRAEVLPGTTRLLSQSPSHRKALGSGRGLLGARIDSRDGKRHIQPERHLPERSECLPRQAPKDHRGFGQVGPLFSDGSTAGFAADRLLVPFCRAQPAADKTGGRDS